MKTQYIFRFTALLSFLFMISLNSFGQELSRKGTLGIQMENNDASTGISVVKVFPNTTASALGLKQGDLVKSINQKQFTDVIDLVAEVGNWRKGDILKVKVLRGTENLLLEAKVVGKPLETSNYGTIIYDHVDFDGGKLRSILSLPEGIDNPPVIFSLPGIGCGSVDYCYQPEAMLKLWVEELVKSGVAVYRVEKPGMGDSEGTKKCKEMDFNYEVAAFQAALDHLKTIKSINPEQIFLYGHSLGTVSAPLVAKGKNVAGIIAWGGIASTWFEYSLKLKKDQRILMGDDYSEIDTEFRAFTPFLYDFYINKMTPDELRSKSEYAEQSKQYFNGTDMVKGLHHYSFFHTLNDVNILNAYKEADCPVLTLAGELDIHAIDTQWAKRLADLVNYYRPNDGTHVIIPKTTHHYFTIPSLELYNERRSNNAISAAYIAKHFNTDVPMIVQKWVKDQIAGEAKDL